MCRLYTGGMGDVVRRNLDGSVAAILVQQRGARVCAASENSAKCAAGATVQWEVTACTYVHSTHPP